MDKALITSQEVIDIVLSGASFDKTLLEQHIVKSQRKYIKQTLGDDLYEDLILAYDSSTEMSEDYQTLNDDYVKPCLARFVMAEALPFIRNNISSAGVIINNVEFGSQSGQSDYGALRSSLFADAEFYRTELKDFLQDNEDTYTLYDCSEFTRRNRPGIILE